MHVPDLRAALEARLTDAWREAWKEVSCVQELPHRTAYPGKSRLTRPGTGGRDTDDRIRFIDGDKAVSQVQVKNFRSDKEAM